MERAPLASLGYRRGGHLPATNPTQLLWLARVNRGRIERRHGRRYSASAPYLLHMYAPADAEGGTRRHAPVRSADNRRVRRVKDRDRPTYAEQDEQQPCTSNSLTPNGDCHRDHPESADRVPTHVGRIDLKQIFKTKKQKDLQGKVSSESDPGNYLCVHSKNVFAFSV